MSKRLICLFSLFLGLASLQLQAVTKNVPVAEKSSIPKQLAKSAQPPVSPKVWLETSANSLLDKMDEQLEVFKADPLALENFLFKNAMTVWDARIMTRGLAGRYWYKSPKSMRKTLEVQWKWTMVRYFLKALPYYKGQRLHLEEKINCLSPRRCWVRATMKVAGKTAMNIDFYTHLSKKDKGVGEWKLIDLRVAGVSMIKHKKGETRQLLYTKGIAGLISALFEKNKKALASLKNLSEAGNYAHAGRINE